MAANPEIPAGGKAVDARWLQQALAAGGALDLPAIRDVAVEEIGGGFGLLGEILRCRLTWEEEAETAPGSVVVKLPSPDPKSLRLCRRLSLYKREYEFYRHIGAQAPVRSPALLYGDFEPKSHDFVLVLEDLGGMTPGDQIAGATAEQARAVVRALARMHGFYWNRTDRPPLAGLYNAFSPKRLRVLQLVYLASLAPALDRIDGLFAGEMRRIVEAYGLCLIDYLGAIAAAPVTFTHGDVRLDNLFFDAGGGDEVAMIDWQVSAIGSGLYDVAYFLGGNIPTELRREIERDALSEYRDIVCGMGAEDFTFEDCWELYRRNMLSLLTVAVLVCGVLDLGDDRKRRLVETGVRRTLNAIEDLAAAEFLPARRSFFSLANGISALFRTAYRVRRALR